MKRVLPGLTTTFMMLLAGPALALSCLPPDVARTYLKLQEARETYLVVHGTLTFDASGLPRTKSEYRADAPASTPIPARLTGEALSQEGFTTPFDRRITLDLRCLGPWCAGGRSGMEIMAFVKRGASGYAATLDPCYSTVFVDPTDQMLEQALSCMRGGDCEPQRH